MSAAPPQEAAERLLATLAAGRAASLQLASTYLPFSRLIALHAAFTDEIGAASILGGMVDRRIDAVSGRLRQPPAERTDDEPTPRQGETVAADAGRGPPASRLQRAIGRAEILRPRPEPAAPLSRAERRSAARRGESTSEVTSDPPSSEAVIVAEEAPEQTSTTGGEAAPPDAAMASESPQVGMDRGAVDAPSGAEAPAPVEEIEPVADVVADPADEGAAPLLDLDEADPPSISALPSLASAHASLAASIAEQQAITLDNLPTLASEDEADSTPPAPPPGAAPGRPAVVGVVAGMASDEEDAVDGDSGGLASGPATVRLGGREGAAAGVRAATPVAEEDPIGGADEEDDMASVGVSAPGGGIQLGGSRRRTAADSGAPRLTDEEEAPATDANLVPHIRPAGDDDRIAQLLDDAVTAAGKGDLQKAIQAFTDVVDLRHDRVDAYIGRGRCYLELGDYSSAMSDFQRAEDLQPDRPDAHVAMGDLYFARKEYRRAIEFYDQAVELDGSHAMARCRRGISHYYRKNYRQAFQDLQRAYSLDPEIPNIRKYVQMAVKKMERGD